MNKHKIAVFASGNGSNAMNLYHFFENHPSIVVALVVCDNPKAGIIEKSKEEGLSCFVLNKEELNGDKLVQLLHEFDVTHIVLAGYLKLIPKSLIHLYKDKIINIHPSLLPAYGGKGMYGMHVHQSVIANNESHSGITIHLVNEEYDKGRILLQQSLEIKYPITAEELAYQVHQLEYHYYPLLVNEYISKGF